MQFYAEFTLQEVFAAVEMPEKGTFRNTVRKPFTDAVGNEHLVNVTSLRLSCFKKNHICVLCGIAGETMILEGSGRPHFNMYARHCNDMILMTKDHIVPISKGGKDILSNLQTMCTQCNHLKNDLHNFPLEAISAVYRELAPEFSREVCYIKIYQQFSEILSVDPEKEKYPRRLRGRKHRRERRALDKLSSGESYFLAEDTNIFEEGDAILGKSVFNPNVKGKLVTVLPAGTLVKPISRIKGSLILEVQASTIPELNPGFRFLGHAGLLSDMEDEGEDILSNE